MGCGSTKKKSNFVVDDSIANTMKKYLLTYKQIHQLWKIFDKADVDKSGSVNAQEIFEVIKEKPNSIVAPYLIEYISDLEKGEGGELKFSEFVRSIAKLCLYTPTQIIQCNIKSVVFKCIDENRDNILTKEEIIFFLKREYKGKLIFPTMFIKSIEMFETERSDKIDWFEFVRLTREVPYLVFPAFRLQEALRLYTLGPFGWKRIYKKLIARKRNEAQEAERLEIEQKEEQEKLWKMQIDEWESRGKTGAQTL